MTFEINGMIVEVKAKGLYNRDRFNKADTMCFMNEVSMWATEAANRYTSVGAYSLATHAREQSEEIYKVLDANGCYDDCR